MTAFGAEWLSMSEEEKAPYREAVKDWPINPHAVALTVSILRRQLERKDAA